MVRYELNEGIAFVEESAVDLWIIGILFFGIGDVVTTTVGLTNGGIAEVGPFVAPILEQYGFAAMAVLKVATFALSWALWRAVPRPSNIGVPLGLAVLGILITSWNTFVLLVATFAPPTGAL